MLTRRSLVASAILALPLTALPTMRAAAATKVPVAGQARVRKLGWLPWTDGVIGTTGRSLPMEAFRLRHRTPIRCRAYMGGVGWQPWVTADEPDTYCGFFGGRIEAVQMTLDPTWADAGYQVQYRAHVQNVGWMDWVTGGATSGKPGKGLRLEALRVRLIRP